MAHEAGTSDTRDVARIDVTTRFREATGDLPALEETAELGCGPWFETSAEAVGARGSGYREWPLRGGVARVYLADGHRVPVRPFLVADGFGYGPSDLDLLFDRLDAPYSLGGERFLERLLTAGVDVVLVGFAERHDYIQANAGVVEDCIVRVIAERDGHAPLVVGGIGVGGIITRYALARMENEGRQHETGIYLSVDSPHNGAWIPLILQHMAYFFERFDRPGQAELLRSPAAQQTLWAWVPDARYSGPVATASSLRAEFLRELRALGEFPRRPIKLGVANGRGDGVGSEHIIPGGIAFQRYGPRDGAGVRFQSDHGVLTSVGDLRFLLEQHTCRTSGVPPLDGAPGGRLDFFGRAADTLDAAIDPALRGGCFVPSVSAVALDYDPVVWDVDPYRSLRGPTAQESWLDDFCCNTVDSEHATMTQTLAEWILARIAK